MARSSDLDMYVFLTHLRRSNRRLTINIDLSQTVHENRIYSLKITCGASYPDVPPEVRFNSRVNLPFVNQTNGKVDPSKLPVLASWSRNNSLESVLVEIRKCVLLIWILFVEKVELRIGKWHHSTTENCLSPRKDRPSEKTSVSSNRRAFTWCGTSCAL